MSLKKRYKTEPASLSRIKNLLEGYDNLAVMSTVDAKEGLFELKFPECLKEEVLSVMGGIREAVEIREYRST